ncbi:MAG: peptidoglycan editing factor PgeF [Clostridiales bacterium]|nr:peptidoglycan editing factor PgeF [Clostridiales bacterium]
MIRYTEIFRPDSTGGIFACFTADRDGRWADDAPETVDNYIRFGKQLGFAPDRIVRTRQRHTDIVIAADRANGGDGIFDAASRKICDGAVTDTPGLLLTVITADCVPVLLSDPVKRAVGAVHSGWRGTSEKITENAVKLMHERYGSDPADIIVYIGPHICKSCYEVGEDVRECFSGHFSDQSLKRYFKPEREGKYLLDLESAVRDTLESAGIKKENIRSSGMCTFESKELYSWRRDHLQNHSILTVIGIQSGADGKYMSEKQSEGERIANRLTGC